jgi:hypothetical protein
MAENNGTEAARAQLEADKAARDRSRQEYEERMKGKPTPTQEENDLAVLGTHVMEKEPDGSPSEPNTKQSQALGGGGYLTRQSRTATGPTGPTGASGPSQPASESNSQMKRRQPLE